MQTENKLSQVEPGIFAPKHKPWKFLGNSEIDMIDEALAAVGPFGEVELIVEKGRLRFVVTKNSHDALKWRPGAIADEVG